MRRLIRGPKKAGFHPCQAKEAACRPAEQAGQADPQGQRHGSVDR